LEPIKREIYLLREKESKAAIGKLQDGGERCTCSIKKITTASGKETGQAVGLLPWPGSLTSFRRRKLKVLNHQYFNEIDGLGILSKEDETRQGVRN